MANTRIIGKPITYVRLAIMTPQATPSTSPADADCLPVIEPKLTKEVKPIDYKIVQDTRYSALKTYSMLTAKLTHKTPFILPKIQGQESGATMLTRYNAAFLDRLLIPAGMVFDTPDYILNEDWQDGYYTTNLYLQELYDTEAILGALCNYKLNFNTSNGCVLEHEWIGLDGGITTGSDLDAMLAQPTIVDALPVFEYAEFQIGVAGESPFDYYLACSEFNFDFGNKVQFYDDANGHAGVSGSYIGNRLDGQKVSFNLMAPNKHGDTIGAETFPYWDYFDAGAVLNFTLKLYGNKTKAEEGGYDSGVTFAGQFQLTDVPEKSETNDLRRIKLGGTMYKNADVEAFTITPFYEAHA